MLQFINTTGDIFMFAIFITCIILFIRVIIRILIYPFSKKRKN